MNSPAVAEVQQNTVHTKFTDLVIFVPLNMESFEILPTFPLFQNINYLDIWFESQKITFWQSMKKLSKQKLIENFTLSIYFIACLVQSFRADDKLDQKERFNRPASLVDLKRITELEFSRTNDLSQLHFIELILL